MLVRYSLTARAQGESEDTIKHTGRAYLTRWAILTTIASEAISSANNVSVLRPVLWELVMVDMLGGDFAPPYESIFKFAAMIVLK